MTDTPTIPSEYEIGLGRGHLGDWIAEVIAAGWTIHIEPPRDYSSGGVSITKPGQVSYWCDWGEGKIAAPFDAELAFVQAWQRWTMRKDGER